MKKFFKIFLWVLVAAVFVGTFVFLYNNGKEKEEVYSTAQPQRLTIERNTVLTGKIEPRDEIEIKPQISGIISEINVEAGDLVKEGDVIAKIKVIPEASQLSSAQSRVSTAEIELTDATAKFKRDKELFAKDVISREEYETSQKNYNKAQEEVEAARDAYNIVREGLYPDVPVKVGSSVIQANTMNDGTTVAKIADMNKLIFKGKVDETEVGKLRVGMPMDITIGAMPDLHPLATIEYISPKGDDSGGANTFEIKAALVLDDVTGLRSGYSANAKVALERAQDVMTVPESVVTFEGDSTFVFVMTDSLPKPEYKRTPVKTGLSDGINIEIKEGIDSTAVLRASKIEQ